MKKQFAIGLILVFSSLSSLQAQHLMSSKIVYNDELQTLHYIFMKVDDNTLEKAWEEYLGKFGSVKSRKGEISLKAISSGTFGNEVEEAVGLVNKIDDFTRVGLIILDKNGESPIEANQGKVSTLFTDFYQSMFFQEEVRMAEEDMEEAKDLKDRAEKDKKKVERKMDSNLRKQEKLGKKMNQTPEEIRKIIEEKDNILQEAEGSPTSKEVEEQISKKDAEIAKNKRKAEKAEDRLVKEEKEFEELKEGFIEAKHALERANEVYQSKKAALEQLKSEAD